MQKVLSERCQFHGFCHKKLPDLFSKFADATAIPEYWGLQGKVAQNIGSQKLTPTSYMVTTQ